MRVDLPGGQWAELRGPETLTGEDDAIVKSALRVSSRRRPDEQEPDPEGEEINSTAGGAVEMELAMIARVVTSWSLPQPVNLANVRKLPIRTLRPLKKAVEPHFAEIRDDADPNPQAEPATGTGSSGG